MISIIHPSRGRPEKSNTTAREWISKCGLEEIELILSLDNDDSRCSDYAKQYFTYPPGCEYTYVEQHNNSLVEATNRAARLSQGDILLYLSDDFKCPDNWGKLILKEFEGVTEPMLLKVDDCLQKFLVPVLTIPIMNRILFDLLGYFFHPDFKSMHCDEHLYQRCKKLGVIKFAPHLKFEHCHVSVGKSQDDDTYRRSAKNWNHGVSMMEKHRRLGFTQ